jgi:hypothetical protein
VRDITPDDLLTVLACEFEKRPQAPTIFDVAPLFVEMYRADGAVLARFPAGARDTVEAFAAAERQCCAGIGWEVETDSVVTLRVTANEAALDVIEQMLQEAHIDGTR